MSAPIPNCYCLADGRVFGGEYPGSLERADAREKIGALLDAGITVFVDLTTPADRMAPYDAILAEEAAARGIEAVRVPVPMPDMDVATPDVMHRILDEIDARVTEGRRVYVHCWGGVGRTGLVVGCHLVRHGSAGDAALATVRERFGSMSPEKVRRHGGASPQTTAQCEMVRGWSRHDATLRRPVRIPTRRDRYLGAMLGLAAGDALGTALEFKAPGTFVPISDMVGGGPFQLSPGQWTDDTSMALCLAESLLERQGFDPEDQMRRYVRWWREGHWSSTGRCFDIGSTVRQALASFERTGVGFSGSTAERAAGNGSIMRLAPVVLYCAPDHVRTVRMAGDSSRTTHGTATAVDGCRYLALLISGALAGVPKDELLSPQDSSVGRIWGGEPLHPMIAAIAAGSFREKSPPAIRGTGYVVDSLEAALWAFHTTSDFRSGALAAANLGDDADTTAAVYGQLAGAYYGVEGIPAEWRDRLARAGEIAGLAERLLAATQCSRAADSRDQTD